MEKTIQRAPGGSPKIELVSAAGERQGIFSQPQINNRKGGKY